MSGLPEGWANSRLESLVEILDSKRIPINSSERETRNKGKTPQNLYPYYGATGQVGQIDDYLFDEPLILLGEDGVPFLEPDRQKAYLVSGKCWVNNHAHVLRAIEMVADRRYIAAYLNHLDYTGLVTGSTRLKLTQAAMRSITVPLAPLLEQKRIADKLDALLARVDACRERLDRVPAILKRFRQSVLAAATTGELTREWREGQSGLDSVAQVIKRTPLPPGKDTGRAAGVKARAGRFALSVGPSDLTVPAGWSRIPLSRVAKLESGHTPSRSFATYWNGGIPWIGIKDARDHHGGTIMSTAQTVSQEGLENSAARLLPARTVCLSRTASVGYVTIMGKPMATSQDFANWICTPALVPEYLMYALMAEGEGLRDFGEGSTHTTIYFPELKALHLALPTPREQAEIIRRTKDLLGIADQIESRYTSARNRASMLVPATLAKAFRGELVPQDPNDEPAAALLARIAATRQNHAAAPRAGRLKGAKGKPKRNPAGGAQTVPEEA